MKRSRFTETQDRIDPEETDVGIKVEGHLPSSGHQRCDLL